MKVKSFAFIRNRDGVTCEPGDVFDLSETAAASFIKDGLVKPYRTAKPAKVVEPEPEPIPEPEEEHAIEGEPIETAMMEDAPEHAVSRRGRRRRRRFGDT